MSTAGFGVKIKAKDGHDFDLELSQHYNFIAATFDKFAVFLRALGASGPNVPHPTPVELPAPSDIVDSFHYMGLSVAAGPNWEHGRMLR